MNELIPIAERIAALLVAQKHTIVIAESSAGGLISAALLAVPGASQFYLGGAIVYSRRARRLLLGLDGLPDGVRSATEAYALLNARRIRDQFRADWALAEAGAAGPRNAAGHGNVYGDAAGHACFALVGGEPLREHAMTLETGKDGRVENMLAFARAGLEFLAADLARSLEL